MTNVSQALAEFAVGLAYERIPPEVVERAKDCIIDTVGACVYGSELPWTRTVIEYAKRNSAPGECAVFGTPLKVRAPFLCQTCHEPTSHRGNVAGVTGGSPSSNASGIGITLARSCLNCHTNIHGTNNPRDVSNERTFRR